MAKFLNKLLIINMGVKRRMNKTKLILLSGVIIGLLLFFSFYLLSIFNLSIYGISPLNNFLSMCGLLITIISGFFLFSMITNHELN
jgi:hypothetical protein